MGQDEELLVAHGHHHGVRDLLGLHGAVRQKAALALSRQHWGPDTLRADSGNPDPAIAVGDGQPFEKDRAAALLAA